MNLATNITIASINYRRLDEHAVSNLDKADLGITRQDKDNFINRLGFEVDEFAIIKKCNAIMVVITFSDSLSSEYVRGRILHVWDEVSCSGITQLVRDIKFFKNTEALIFLAECAVGIHSVTIGDSQVLSQIRSGLNTSTADEKNKVLKYLAEWVSEVAEECNLKTDIFQGNTSLERIASNIVLDKIPANNLTILVGFGKSGKLISKILNKENNRPLVIVNRTEINTLKEGFNENCTYSSFDSYKNQFATKCIIIALENNQKTRVLIEKLLQKINSHPRKILFIDVSTPSLLRDFSTECVGVTDLSKIAELTIGKRQDSVSKAKKIIEKNTKNIIERINHLFADLYVSHQKNLSVYTDNGNLWELISRRGLMIQHIREKLFEKKFLEIFTPYIVGISTDPPKVDRGTTINVDWANGVTAFLRQSNQIYKQICVAGSLKKVYEIGPLWRNEAYESYRHLQETIGLDIEMQSPQNIEKLYKLACELIKSTNDFILANCDVKNSLSIPRFSEIPVISYNQAIELLRENGNPINRGEDFGLVSEARLGQLIKKAYGHDIFVIINYPDTIKKFYTKEKGMGLTETFDIILDGWEIVSGAIRQTNGQLIKKSMKLSGINPSEYEFYIKLVDGAPEHGGFCLGLDRLLAKILGEEMVSDAVPFPRTYRKLIP